MTPFLKSMLEHSNKYVAETHKYTNTTKIRKEVHYLTIAYYKDGDELPALIVMFCDYGEKSAVIDLYKDGVKVIHKSIYPHADLSFFLKDFLTEFKSVLLQ